MDEDEDYELPGGDDFEDVTDLFREAGKGEQDGQSRLCHTQACNFCSHGTWPIAPHGRIHSDGFHECHRGGFCLPDVNAECPSCA